jgi:hypothetical protein
MSTKFFVSIKTGLIEDPKHRQRMGKAVWLFMWIINKADWKTGKVRGWKDEREAAEMSMPVDTMRKQKGRLISLGYITAEQHLHFSDIIIHSWHNPKSYSGEAVNNVAKNGEHEGINIAKNGEHIRPAKWRTSTYSSHRESHMSSPALNSEIQTALYTACKRNPTDKNQGRFSAVTVALVKLGATPELIAQQYVAAAGYWYATDFRGRDKKSPPTPEQIQETWGAWSQTAESQPARKVYR